MVVNTVDKNKIGWGRWAAGKTEVGVGRCYFTCSGQEKSYQQGGF